MNMMELYSRVVRLKDALELNRPDLPVWHDTVRERLRDVADMLAPPREAPSPEAEGEATP